jgi:hypothetical protein
MFCLIVRIVEILEGMAGRSFPREPRQSIRRDPRIICSALLLAGYTEGSRAIAKSLGSALTSRDAIASRP